MPSVSFKSKLYTSLIFQIQYIIVRQSSVYSSSPSDIYNTAGPYKIIIGYFLVKFRARMIYGPDPDD